VLHSIPEPIDCCQFGGIPMDTSQAKQITRAAPVWAWDGDWLPAVVAEAGVKRGGGFLIVRLEHGVTMPVPMARLRPRNPTLRGADKPRRRWQ
jgi:hypothetical protein